MQAGFLATLVVPGAELGRKQGPSGDVTLIICGPSDLKKETSMRSMALILAAAFALSIPVANVVKAEDKTIIKKDRDFDRDWGGVVIKKKEPRHLYMEDRDRDDVHVGGHGPGVGVDVVR
jgi:hypothetical protein